MPKSGKIYRQTAIAVLLCGITSSLVRHPLMAKAAEPVAGVSYPIITRIVARHYTVLVAEGPDAPVYTVIGDDGRKLSDHMALAEMKQSNPTLLKHIAPVLPTGTVDASIDLDSAIGD